MSLRFLLSCAALATLVAVAHPAAAAPELKRVTGQPEKQCDEKKQRVWARYVVLDAGREIGEFSLCRSRDDSEPLPRLAMDGKGRAYVLVEEGGDFYYDVQFLTVLRVRPGFQDVLKMPIRWAVDMGNRTFEYAYEATPNAAGGLTLRLSGRLEAPQPDSQPPCCVPTDRTLLISVDEGDD